MKHKKAIYVPFIHYRIEVPELLQAVLLIAVGLSGVPVLEQYLGMSYEVAITTVAIAELLGILHVMFGDPVVPGWVASALPLVITYLSGYQVGSDSVYAMIALQILVAALFLILGITGLAHKLMKVIPASLKAGILLGAAMEALEKVYSKYWGDYRISICAGGIVTVILLFSMRYKMLKSKSKILTQIGKYGMLPGLIVAMIVGPLVGELNVPSISWGFIPFDFTNLIKDYSVFAIGLPTASYFLKALPMALAVYIIAFGEIVTAEAVLKEAEEGRPEEPIGYNSNRTNVIAGIRNLILALFAPFAPLAGPLWAAVSVSVCERYKEGPKAMQSIYSGMGTFKLFTAFFVLLLPVASICGPVLPIAYTITLLVQCIACSYIAIELVGKDKTAAGIAGLTASLIVVTGSVGWAMAIGLMFCLILELNPFNLAKTTKETAKLGGKQ